jgi:hypothetical protein
MNSRLSRTNLDSGLCFVSIYKLALLLDFRNNKMGRIKECDTNLEFDNSMLLDIAKLNQDN